MSRLSAVLLAAILPLPLWAQACPTASDLTEGGIIFEFEEGDSETFRELRPGLIESVYAHDAEASGATRVLLAKGLYVLEIIELERGELQPNTRLTYAFPVAADALLLPETETNGLAKWSYKVAYNDVGYIDQETQTFTPQPKFEKSYGDCTYDVLPVHVHYSETPLTDRDVLHYLPALGISYLAGNITAEGEETYEYQSIRSVK